MIKMNATQMAQIIEGKLSGEASLQNETEFKFDSREIKAGDVFLALMGEHADGHDFVNQALQNGAVLSIVSKSVAGAHILVPDVVAAIGKLAKFVRDSLSELKVIGITGSQGKTTTKDMLNSILSGQGETIAAKGSFNNDLGVPLTLLRAKPSTRFCIVEMGARHGGDISALAKMATPNVGAVLKVGNAHIGEFGSRENIAKAKGELINSLQSGAFAVLGTYDEFTPKMSFTAGVKKITFGESHECDVRAADIEFRGGYAHFDLVTPESREPVALRVMGLHQIPNALAAAAISHVLNVSTQSIAAALSEHEANSKWRMEIHDLNEVLLINDSYNANPESMEAALKTLVLLTQERGGRSWAFLGTMHELGPDSVQMHKRIGHLVGELGIDHLVSIANRDYLDGLSQTQTQTHYFESVTDAKSLETAMEAGDVVLVKASRAEHLEELANAFIEIRKANGEEENEK
ncbi:MAG: UDP-N-acetylmuramoyl-tripeptide--D-alanyl-D-alanine ligase [Candidatus Nanopelagicaceae bacterium]|nr:UDP-N-acetylmuramoyl-tripeptide--D-alanyl-D-alanine ligase [Candidatus Nanopelagicaceae bacterium]